MSDKFAIDHIIGSSAWTERVRKRIVQVAGYRYSVLVTGPGGTGKELVARAFILTAIAVRSLSFLLGHAPGHSPS